MYGRRIDCCFSYACSVWWNRSRTLVRAATWKQLNLNSVVQNRHAHWTTVDNPETISATAEKPIRSVTPMQLMFVGKSDDGRHLLRSSQFLQSELPRRIARRIQDFQNLPNEATLNPNIQELHGIYMNAFKGLSSFKKELVMGEVCGSSATASEASKIETLSDEEEYTELLQRMLDELREVVGLLAKAFRALNETVPYEVLGSFTERMLKDKLSIRLLVEHHIGLCHEKTDYIGSICTRTSPKHLLEICQHHSQRMCEHRHGCSPGVTVSGHTHATFPHFPCMLEYVLQELLKNAMEATIVHWKKIPDHGGHHIPPVDVTICNNDEHFVIRISDKGGGIPEERLKEIFKYSVTSHSDDENISSDGDTDGGVFGSFVDAVNIASVGGRISGYGFGLPSARAYAEFLGGHLNFVPMLGLGSDVYLKISHITSETIKI